MTIHLRRLYLPNTDGKEVFQIGSLFEPEIDAVHYISNVLRMKVDDKIRVFDGRQGEWLASLEECSRKRAVLQLKEKLREQIQPSFRGLIFSPLKKDTTEDVIRMGTELGVTNFYPTIMERTNLRPLNENRLETIMVEAAEQSERLDIPQIHELKTLNERLQSWDAGEIAVALERRETKPTSDCSSLLIGPEGGFSPNEQKIILNSNQMQAFSLGNNILRAPTAVCAGLAILNINKG